MFIAGSYMLYSAASGAPAVVPVPAAYAAAAAAAALAGPTGNPPNAFPVSAFAAPVLHRHRLQHHGPVPNSSPPPQPPELVLKKMTGFSVSDILERERAVPVPKTAACVIVSRESPSASSSSSSASSTSAHSGSVSPSTPPLSSADVHSESPVALLSRELKFGVERILSSDVAPPKDVSFSPQPYTCCVSPVTPSLRARIPVPCDCPHPYCDGGGPGATTLYPLYAYPAASALAQAMPYPACTLYNPGPHHMPSDMDPRIHQVGLSHSSGPVTSSGKRKRSWSRAVFSNLQRKGLEKRFQIQKYITKPDRRQLAATLGLTDAQVKVWFQNRRMKWRHSKEAKEELAKQQLANKTTEAPPDGVKDKAAESAVAAASSDKDAVPAAPSASAS